MLSSIAGVGGSLKDLSINFDNMLTQGNIISPNDASGNEVRDKALDNVGPDTMKNENVQPVGLGRLVDVQS